ncbi:MAG: SpoIVB peptidase [Clostridia bacterium]|nr:SpoIVB peptidase [Clostridia bacterium]MBQ8794138.1 SpoIVB peptidase [Clostridia bacterium]
MKKIIKLLLAIFSFVLIINFNVKPTNAYAEKIYLGGMPAGFSLQTKGATVVGICDVITKDGLVSPAKDSEIKIGDVILSIGEYEINSASDIEFALNNSLNKNVSINRGGKIISEKIIPAKDINGNFRLGVFVRDNVNGIGTVTYIKGNRFASLGHPVTDDNGEILKIIGGELFSCNITGCVKGERGKAGELRGVFLTKNKIATIDKNNTCGVFGEIESSLLKTTDLIEVGIGEARMGDAQIYSTISGNSPEKYDITIIKTDYGNQSKNFVIKINDKKLLDTTGGIVQGMSGSPILQDGKLVGAVTHVFINDPTRGFGISINNMINA